MLGSIYIGLSGMMAYSKGLVAISNNVANLNTPGFKVSQPSFFDTLFRNGTGALTGTGGAPNGGAGVGVDTNRQSFRQGELRDTGNPLDVAVDGNGFFVIERDDQLMFTRAGEFEIDKDGALVERSTQAKVLVTTASSGSTAFDLDGYRVFAPKASTEVKLTGTLVRTGTATFELPNINVVDGGGGKQILKAKFVRNDADPLKWAVEVVDADGVSLGQGTFTFTENGTPTADSRFEIEVKPKDLDPFKVNFTCGVEGSFAGVTSLSSAQQSSVSVLKQDGLELGTLTQMSFDDRGRLKLRYSNGETLTPATLLLAQFTAPDQFKEIGGGLFTANDRQRPELAVAQSSGRGTIVGGKLELSNVDLTQQFSDLIVIQRGYQASSQMSSVANEMIQQLLMMGDRR